MSETSSVPQSLAIAWRHRLLFVPVYLLLRLLTYAVIAPVLGLAISLAVSLSDQTALTDQDIARFILTVPGFLVTVLVLGLLLVAEVLGLAVMTGVLRARSGGLAEVLRAALGQVAARFGALLSLAVRLLLRVVLMALPFVLVALLVAQRRLTEFDINYYLSERPPDFLAAVGLIGLILLALIATLAPLLARWALALHAVLFGEIEPRAAFGESGRLMQGRRWRMARDLLVWLLLRLALASVVAVIFAALIQWVPIRPGAGLRPALALVLVLSGLWALAAAVVAALTLGALAALLLSYFERVAPAVAPLTAAPRRAVRPGLLLAGLALLVAAGLSAGGALINRVGTPDQVEIIAHRGGAAARPENTLAAVAGGIEDRADWIEIDVQETADDALVVVHDSDFMKLAGEPLKVWDATLSDLSGIDIGSWFDPAFADERTPLLSEVLEMAQGRAKVLIELKYYGHDKALEERVAELVEAYGMQDEVAIMSLKYDAVQKFRELRPGWRTGVLAASAVGDVAGLDGDFVAISTAFASPRLIREAQAADKDVYVWTVNDPLEMSAMISRGVDGLITDEPGMVHRVLEARAEMGTAERLMLWMSHTLGLRLNTGSTPDAEP